MRTYMIIPTYWSGPNGDWKEGDAIYDHATPLDKPGTLKRTLESLHILDDKNFTLVIIAAATNNKYADKMTNKLTRMIKQTKPPVNTILFAEKNLKDLKKEVYKNIEIDDLLSLRGYSNIRNLCLLIPYILDADIAVLIDDDEIFEDPAFMTKAKEFIGKRFYGNKIDGVAGYYLNEDNEYYDKVNIDPWMTYWDRFGEKRKAFDKIIGQNPRLKKSPFAFGGAMVIHRKLMRIVPFDPKVTRGEDTDYVINSKIFGFNFYLDNELSIKHLPPAKNQPVWRRLREDMLRFLYNKSKFDHQNPTINLHEIKQEDFDPYPGNFIKSDLGDKIFKTNVILALDYLADGDIDSCKETIKNIYLAQFDAIPDYDTYDSYLQFQKEWRRLLRHTTTFGDRLKNIILKGQVITFDKYKAARKRLLLNSKSEVEVEFRELKFFEKFTDKELRKFFPVSEIVNLKKDDYIINSEKEENNIFIVLQGLLHILRNHSDDQAELFMANIEPGEMFNEISLFFKEYQFPGMGVKAMTDTDIMVINKEKLLSIMKKNTGLSSKILWAISKKISHNLKMTTEKFSDSKVQELDVSDIL